MAILIREATMADVYDVARVHVLSWQSAYHNIVPDNYLHKLEINKRAERFKKDFVAYKGITYFYVAENNGRIIGNIALSKCRDDDKPLSGEIIGIYLLKEYWSMGYGKKLMDFGINKLREFGYSEVCLWVLDQNRRARNFYERYGFLFDGTKKEINLGKQLVEIRYVLNFAV